jgi:hypothetical protein
MKILIVSQYFSPDVFTVNGTIAKLKTTDYIRDLLEGKTAELL